MGIEVAAVTSIVLTNIAAKQVLTVRKACAVIVFILLLLAAGLPRPGRYAAKSNQASRLRWRWPEVRRGAPRIDQSDRRGDENDAARYFPI